MVQIYSKPLFLPDMPEFIYHYTCHELDRLAMGGDIEPDTIERRLREWRKQKKVTPLSRVRAALARLWKPLRRACNLPTPFQTHSLEATASGAVSSAR